MKWVHQKSRHLGEKATYRGAQERGIKMSLDVIKTIIAQYPMCQHTNKCPVPNILKGQLRRGKLPAHIWQMDYIGPLPQDQECKYVCTAVDTHSGYLIAHPCKKATHHLYYGPNNFVVWNSITEPNQKWVSFLKQIYSTTC